jgi:hypothetical protein
VCILNGRNTFLFGISLGLGQIPRMFNNTQPGSSIELEVADPDDLPEIVAGRSTQQPTHIGSRSTIVWRQLNLAALFIYQKQVLQRCRFVSKRT